MSIGNVMTAYLQSVNKPYLRNTSSARQETKSAGNSMTGYDSYEKSTVSESQNKYYNYDELAKISKNEGNSETDNGVNQTEDNQSGSGASGQKEKVTRKIVNRNGVKFLEITTEYPDGRTTVESQILSGQGMRRNQNMKDLENPLAKMLTM